MIVLESVADEILESHEKEITRTHILIEDQKHILERVEKHMRLVEEIKQFEVCIFSILPTFKLQFQFSSLSLYLHRHQCPTLIDCSVKAKETRAAFSAKRSSEDELQESYRR